MTCANCGEPITKVPSDPWHCYRHVYTGLARCSLFATPTEPQGES